MSHFPETHRDLLDAQFATLATTESDGQPQLRPSNLGVTGSDAAQP